MILVILFIVYNFVNSRTGRAVMAIRDNRIAAESVGINITKFKLMAFTISAAIAVLAVCFMRIIFLPLQQLRQTLDTICPS